MKYKKVVLKEDSQKEKELIELFGYEIVSIKNRKTTDVIYFNVDNHDPKFLSKMDLFNKVTRKSVLPIWPLLVFSIASITLFTIVLIIYLCNRSNPNNFIYFMSLGIPAAVIMLVAVFYTSKKFKTDTFNMNLYDTREDIKKELSKIDLEENND